MKMNILIFIQNQIIQLINKMEENKRQNRSSLMKKREKLNTSQQKSSSNTKNRKSSKFNTRIATCNRDSNPRRKIIHHPQNNKKFASLRKSSTAESKSRPGTYGNKSQINISNRMSSLSNIKSSQASISRKKIYTSGSKHNSSQKT